MYFDFPDSTELDHAILDLSDSPLIERVHVSGYVRIHLEPNAVLPNLTHLSLDLLYFNFSQPPTELPRTYDREHWVFKAWEHMPNLISLSVVTSECSPISIPYYDGPVTLTSLNQLELICKGKDDYMSFYFLSRNIFCPSLQEFIVSSTLYEPEECRRSVSLHDGSHQPPSRYLGEGLMWATEDTLEKLAINCDNKLEPFYLQVLALYPGMRHLYVANSRECMNSAIISALKHERVECVAAFDPRHQREVICDFRTPNWLDDSELKPPTYYLAWFDVCPKLESILFKDPLCKCGSDCDYALEEIVDMLAARWDKDGSTLRSFKIQDSEIRDFDEHPTIKRIRSSPRYCPSEWVVNI